jgi:flagellar basal-body rod protein FlgB
LFFPVGFLAQERDERTEQMLTDSTQIAVERALSGVAERQRVSAHNLANAVTPGFRSQRVTFEEQLGQALRAGRPDQAGISTVAANTPVDINGNDVLVEEETTILLESGVRYEALAEALNYKFGLLRTAIGGS